MSDLVGTSSIGTWELYFNDPDSTYHHLEEWCLRIWELKSVEQLTCVEGSSLGTATLSWINAETYDAVSIWVNGEEWASLGELELESGTLAADDRAEVTLAGLAKPQVAQFAVFGVQSGTRSASSRCRLPLFGEPVSAQDEPEQTVSRSTTPYLGIFSFDAPEVIRDARVRVDIAMASNLRDLEVVLAPWDGTSVTLHADRYAPPGSYGLNLTYWEHGWPNGFPSYSYGNYMQPVELNGLADLNGMSAFDPVSGTGTWTVAVHNGSLEPAVVKEVTVELFAETLPEAPSDVTCALSGAPGGVLLSWTHGGNYDAVRLYSDELLIEELDGPFHAGDAYSFEYNVSEVPNRIRLAVQGVAGDGLSNASSCNITASLPAVEDLHCSRGDGEGEIRLSWSLPAVVGYDFLEVSSDGELLALLPGDATTWSTTDADPELEWPAFYELSVVGGVDAVTGRSAHRHCATWALDTVDLESCSDDAPIELFRGDSGVTIDADGVVEHLELTIDVSTSFLSSRSIILRSPSDTTVVINGPIPGSTSEPREWNLWFTDSGTPISSVDVLDCECPLASYHPLEAMIGEPVRGDWFLYFVPRVISLEGWCLRTELCSAVAPAELACRTTEEGVELTWDNVGDYEFIEIYRDRALIEMLREPGATSFLDATATSGRSTYFLRAITSGDACAIRTPDCSIIHQAVEECVEDIEIGAVGGFTDGRIPIIIYDPMIVGQVEVHFAMTHSATTNSLGLLLESPAGTSIRLHNGDAGPVVDVTWSDDSDHRAKQRLYYEPSDVRPWSGHLADFAGELADGEWNVEYLHFGNGVGMVHEVCLTVVEGCPTPPPALLACEAVEGQLAIELSWVNSAVYDKVVIERDGAQLVELPGYAEEYEDSDLAPGFYQYRIYGKTDAADCFIRSKACDSTVRIFRACSEGLTHLSDLSMSQVEILEEKTVDAISVSVDMRFQSDWPIELELLSPNGDTILLYRTGAPAEQTNRGLELRFADSETFLPSYHYPCADCVLTPLEPLHELVGDPTIGVWTLRAVPAKPDDVVPIDFGRWCLNFTLGCDDLPPDRIICTSNAGANVPVRINWRNRHAYDEIIIERDGVPIASIPGDSTEYDDTSIAAPDHYEFDVIGVDRIEQCHRRGEGCHVELGPLEACAQDVLEIEEISGLGVIDWSNELLEAALARDPAIVPTVGRAEIRINGVSTPFQNSELTLFSPSGTVIRLKTSTSMWDRTAPFDVIFADQGWRLSCVSHVEQTFVLPDGPGSLIDLAGEDPRGEWFLVADSVLKHDFATVIDQTCIKVFLSDFAVFQAVSPRFLRGDANGDGEVNPLADAIRLLQWGFGSGIELPCHSACDVNNDGELFPLQDALLLLAWQFLDGSPPPEPGPDACGIDPEDAMSGGAEGCEEESSACRP